MIYVVTHKDVNLSLPKNYRLIGVGQNLIFGEDIHDDIFDNISKKNQNYCELTGLYWIWKNVKDDIIGLTHYRRVFTEDDINSVDLISYDDAEKILNVYDIILPPLFNNENQTVYEHYCSAHIKKDIDNVRIIVLNKYPEYIESYDYIMNQKYEYGFNMFIAKKELIDEYLKWLFDILFELEKCSNLSGYDDYQKRIFGFISERLFTIWIYHNKLKIKELVVIDPSLEKDLAMQKKIKKLSRSNIDF